MLIETSPRIALPVAAIALLAFSLLLSTVGNDPLPVGSTTLINDRGAMEPAFYLTDAKSGEEWHWKVQIETEPQEVRLEFDGEFVPKGVRLYFASAPVDATTVDIELRGQIGGDWQPIKTEKHFGVNSVQLLIDVPVPARALAMRAVSTDLESTWAIDEIQVTGQLGGHRYWLQLLSVFGITVATAIIAGLLAINVGWIRSVCVGAAALSVGVIAVLPAIRGDTWQRTHDAYNWHTRTQIYAEQLTEGSVIPVWSSTSSSGFGSPLPVLYHKLYTGVSGFLYLALQDGIQTHWFALALFAAIGAAGLYKCLRSMDVVPQYAAIVAALLPLCNYPFASWYIRGAMAEHSALQLIPWIFWWCVEAIKSGSSSSRRLYWSGSLLLLLLYAAHSLIFFFAFVPVGVALLVRLSRNGKPLNTTALIGALGLTLALFIAPVTVVQRRLAEEFAFFNQMQIHEPSSSLHQYKRYFQWEPERWHELQGFFRIDNGVWITTVVMLVVVVGHAGISILRGNRIIRPGPAGWFFALMTGWYTFLILPLSGALYQTIPGFHLLQFPFRLLSFLTVLGLILFGMLANQLRSIWGPLVSGTAIALASAWTLYASSVFMVPEAPNTDDSALRFPLHAGRNMFVGSAFEYYPSIEGVDPGYATFQWLRSTEPQPNFLEDHRPARYRLKQEWPRTPEPRVHVYAINVLSDREVEVVLPVNWSGYESLESFAGGVRRHVETFRYDDDPRVRFICEPEVTRIQMRTPTVGRVLIGAKPRSRNADPAPYDR